jgi:hypothetical protein
VLNVHASRLDPVDVLLFFKTVIPAMECQKQGHHQGGDCGNSLGSFDHRDFVLQPFWATRYNAAE